jgi:hypothetical protein
MAKATEERILARLDERDPEEAHIAREILAWARRRGLRLSFGQGRHDGSVWPVFDRPDGASLWLIGVRTTGVIEVQFGPMASRPPFDKEEKRAELHAKLNALEASAFRASCSRCGHETESFGSSERSIERCLALMREECPAGEMNFYVAEDA